MPSPKQQSGSHGEDLATAWLVKRGYQILDRNVHLPGGELDIITTDPAGKLVFFEVRLRRNQQFGTAVESITYSKQQRLVKACHQYISLYGGRSQGWQLDFLGIDYLNNQPQITHIPHMTA